MQRVFVISAAIVYFWVPAVQAQMGAAKVVVAKARTIDARPTITLVGTVEPVRRSSVGSEVSGIIVQMPVREGDQVEAGDVLCRLDDTALRLRLAEAEARWGSLKAAHSELQTGSRPEELARLEAMAQEAAAEHDRWKFEMERVRGLYQGQESNAKEYTDTQASFQASLRRKIAAEADHELGINGPRTETIARAAFEVAEQLAVVDSIKHDLDRATLRAPFAGHVVSLSGEVGEWVAVGGQIGEMVDLRTVLVRVDAPESAFPYLVVGGNARVRVDALNATLQGRIKHVIRQANQQARTFPVYVELDNAQGLLAGGLFARVSIPAGPSEPVIAVPKDALVERGGIDYIAAIIPGKDGALQGMLMAVTVGQGVREWIAITSGNVPEGMRVITHGNENMQPFPKPVSIVDDKGVPVAMPSPKVDPSGEDGA